MGLKYSLEKEGYDVIHVKTKRDALESLKENEFDMCILDINLPDGTGFEVCEELRSVSNVPVIFASARTSVDDRIIGFEKGGDDYLPKPFSMKELLVRVKSQSTEIGIIQRPSAVFSLYIVISSITPSYIIIYCKSYFSIKLYSNINIKFFIKKC